MGEPVEQGGGHFGIAEDAGPFGEGEVGRDDDRCALVEPADQVEQQLAAGLGEGQIAELIENEEIDAGEPVGDAAMAAELGFALQPVDQVDGIEEARLAPGPDHAAGHADGNVALASPGAADQHYIALAVEEAAAGELLDQLGRVPSCGVVGR